MALIGRVESTPELEDRPALAAPGGTDEVPGDEAVVADGEKVMVLPKLILNSLHSGNHGAKTHLPVVVGEAVGEVVLVKQDVSLLAPTVTCCLL